MSTESPPTWDPNYVTPDWVWGAKEIRHWELVITTQYGENSVGTKYSGTIVYPDGRLIINNQEIQCSSVEEAKELGMTTYLLTREGE